MASELYADDMDVGVTELRANLSDWLARVRDGEEVTITDRGLPIARLSPIVEAALIERLTREGVLCRPESSGPRYVPHPITVPGDGPSASDIIIEFRDEKR
jgi:prevent-host-death family protein